MISLEPDDTSCYTEPMRWAYSSLVLSVVSCACATDKSTKVTDVPTQESDATTNAESGGTTSQANTAMSSGSQGSHSDGTTTPNVTALTSSNGEAPTSTEPDVTGTPTSQPQSSATPDTSSTPGNSEGPTSCTSHADCEADEICVDSSTRSDCGQGLCTKGIICGAQSSSVCDPNQPRYTVNDAGEVVPDDRWTGRLCHSCGGLNCAVGDCFRCVSPP